MLTPETQAKLESVTARHSALELVVLHGSRARGEAEPDSDWDFAVQAGPTLDVLRLQADLAEAVGVDAVDLAVLGRAGAVLRFHVARDGVPLWEREPGAWEAYRRRAVGFWCDAEVSVRRAQAAFLDTFSAAGAGRA